ncbi:TPA: hypothetical protein ACWLUJ_005740 [Pseudomonas aeruginosa]|nr:hypothetical protein [Pseudomonas aeruginosa]
MSKELNDLLAIAAADYRARGDMATAERFEAYCADQQSSSEVLELEPPEVVAWSVCAGSKKTYDFKQDAVAAMDHWHATFPSGQVELTELMSVAQYDRTVGQLRAKVRAWKKFAEDRESQMWSAVAERDAAQSRTAELQADLDRSAEGADIIRGLIASIEKKGNYTAESTINFLSQALGCFNRFG